MKDSVILKLAKKHKNIVLLNSDCSQSVGISSFPSYFYDRYFNFGMAENNMVSSAAGFCIVGKVPFITGYSSFLTERSFDQIKNDICYPNLNVKIVGMYSGFSSGQEGVAYHGVNDIALMRSLPNMKVFCPADYYEAMSCIEMASETFGPVYLRIYGGEMQSIYSENYKFQIGKASILREGSDVCIFAISTMVSNCLEVAKKLKVEGIDASIVNVSSIKPIDAETIVECSKKSKFCVTVEDHNIIGGLGSAVSEILAENNPVVVRRIGIKDKFTESGKVPDLYKKYGLDVEGVSEKIRDFINRF